MALKKKWNIVEFLVLVHFPFYGMFSFLRIQDMKILGYLVYILPMILFVGWRLLCAMKNSDARLPVYLSHKENRLHALFFFGLMLIMMSGLVTSAIIGSREWIFAMAEVLMIFIVVVFWILVFESVRFKKNGLQSIFSVIIMSLMIYAAMNITSVLIGFESQAHMAQFTREIEAIFSPLGVRLNFPFALSGQHFAILGGILIILSLRGSKCLGFSVVTRFFIFSLGLSALIGQSARAPIAALFLVLAYGVIVRKMGRNLITPLLLGIMIMPVAIVYLNIGHYLYQLMTVIGLDISRSTGDVASLSNRDVIWEAAFNHMFYYADIFHSVFGYGAFGQIASGIDDSYSWLFKGSYAEHEHHTLHNTYVQTFVDYGILGVFFLMGVLLVVLRRLNRKVYRIRMISPDILILMILLYLSICAVTEVIIGYYAFDLLSIFIFFNLYVMAQKSTEMQTYTLIVPRGEF